MKWKQNSCPEKPKTRKEQTTEGEKIDHRTQNCRQQHKDPIFTAADVEGKQKIAAQTQQTEQQIQKLRDPTELTPQPTKKIIADSVAKAEKGSQQKLAAL